MDISEEKKQNLIQQIDPHRSLKSGYTILLGNPLRQIRMPSSTPLQVSWCITRCESMTPGCFNSLGMIQRTKWGWVALNVVIRLFNCSLYDEDTVEKPPPFLPRPPLPPPPPPASPDWPGWSAKISISNLLVDFLNWSTTVSLSGSLFFSSQPVMLYGTWIQNYSIWIQLDREILS